MLRTAALPFVLRRSHDVVAALEITTTRELLHGLIRLDGDQIVIQWRASREVSHVGTEIRTDHELAPLREVTIPLGGFAGARLRRVWHSWLPGEALVLTAADLRAFAGLGDEPGTPGLLRKHPAELLLDIRRADRMLAREFASELNLALADRLLRIAEGESPLQLPQPAPAVNGSMQRDPPLLKGS